MARPLEKISDVNDEKELWKVAVKIHHKWSVISNNKEHFEMVVYDSEVSFNIFTKSHHFSLFSSKRFVSCYIIGFGRLRLGYWEALMSNILYSSFVLWKPCVF